MSSEKIFLHFRASLKARSALTLWLTRKLPRKHEGGGAALVGVTLPIFREDHVKGIAFDKLGENYQFSSYSLPEL